VSAVCRLFAEAIRSNLSFAESHRLRYFSHFDLNHWLKQPMTMSLLPVLRELTLDFRFCTMRDGFSLHSALKSSGKLRRLTISTVHAHSYPSSSSSLDLESWILCEVAQLRQLQHFLFTTTMIMKEWQQFSGSATQVSLCVVPSTSNALFVCVERFAYLSGVDLSSFHLRLEQCTPEVAKIALDRLKPIKVVSTIYPHPACELCRVFSSSCILD
jgi:hypothetical protein